MTTSPRAKPELYRLLPSVDELLRDARMSAVCERNGHSATVSAARALLEQMRNQIASGWLEEDELKSIIDDAPLAIERTLNQTLGYSLRPVVNATGVILHTNLGRSPLSRAALDHAVEIASGYSNLEFDLETGERGKRDSHVDRLFAQLLNTVERDVATIVVNNNAAAVLLVLNALAEGGEVIVSRGELVEIGGSFRIPDVMAKSGAVLREVGTTNRTRIADYEAAISGATKLILRVHRSNFQIVGFAEQPSLQELVALGRQHGIPVMEDLGSGDMLDLRTVGVRGEPTLADSLHTGVDVVTYSGDKLLGGPQAGLISGSREVVEHIRENPLFRAVRVDKMFYAALEATLLAYARQDYDAVPVLRMMRMTEEEIAQRSGHLMTELQTSCPELTIEVLSSRSVLGGGAAPGSTLPTRVLAISSAAHKPDEIAGKLRRWKTPIIVRVEEGRVLIDLRTVMAEQEPILTAALASIST